MRYTAKRASLKTIKGCSVPGCGCYTDRGWYVQCREGGSLDTVLFVCEDCFERLYRAKSIIGSFDEGCPGGGRPCGRLFSRSLVFKGKSYFLQN